MTSKQEQSAAVFKKMDIRFERWNVIYKMEAVFSAWVYFTFYHQEGVSMSQFHSRPTRRMIISGEVSGFYYFADGLMAGVAEEDGRLSCVVY